MKPVGDTAGRIAETAEALRAGAVSFLRDLVETNSWSGNPEGINRVGDALCRRFRGLGADVRVLQDAEGVGHYLYDLGVGEGSRVLLAGHIDTVFQPGSPAGAWSREGGRITGPGTADMKGGVVVILYALEVLRRLGLLDTLPVRVFINGDEETGSGRSAAHLGQLASDAACALVFECGGLEGQVVDSRRGVARFRLDVTGEARHSGVKSGPKASALLELARLIVLLEGINDMEGGVSCNVGQATGGVGSNIVPAGSWALLEVRYWDRDGEEQVRRRLDEIVAGPMPPGCRAQLTQLHSRPAWQAAPGASFLTDALFSAAESLGQRVQTERRGGGSDANLLAAAGVPTLDGLGPVGDRDHSPEEYILEDTLVERIALTAQLLLNITENLMTSEKVIKAPRAGRPDQ